MGLSGGKQDCRKWDRDPGQDITDHTMLFYSVELIFAGDLMLMGRGSLALLIEKGTKTR